MDIATQIGEHVRSIMLLVSDIDGYMPDEAEVEVLIDVFGRWATIESNVVFPAVTQYADGSDELIDAAEKRLELLRAMEDDMHLGEGADAPYSETAGKYIAAVKYHLIVDVQDLAPLTMQIPDEQNRAVARRMQRLRDELDG